MGGYVGDDDLILRAFRAASYCPACRQPDTYPVHQTAPACKTEVLRSFARRVTFAEYSYGQARERVHELEHRWNGIERSGRWARERLDRVEGLLVGDVVSVETLRAVLERKERPRSHPEGENGAL